jgi:hypothetical protein
MFMGPADYPDRAVLIRLISQASQRIDSQGVVTLTAAEAEALRAAGYTTALGPGAWPIPQLPLGDIGSIPALRPLTIRWYGERALASPPPSPPGARHSFLSPERGLRFSLAFFVLRDASQRALLLSLARFGPTKRRRLQQAHGRRLPAARFNPALKALLQASLVVQSDGLLSVNPLAIEPLNDLTGAVCQAGVARTQRRSAGRASKREERRKTVRAQSRPRRRRPYKRRPIPDRRSDPRGWALAMLGRRGGLARQRQARGRGELPTAKATQARLTLASRRRRRSLTSDSD